MKPKLFGRLAAAAVLLLSAATATAHDFEVDGIYYNYNGDGISVSVTYKGDTYDAYTNEYSGLVTIPTTVSFSDKTYSVTSISTSAFNACSDLTDVIIPSSVLIIDFFAFYGCTGLMAVELPNSLISIGYNAFANCTSLVSLEIPNSVTTIGLHAFYGCKSLTSVVIPDNVTTISIGAFQFCSSLKHVSIGKLVTSIPESTFDGCSSLMSIIIGDSVTSIDKNAFQNCNSLSSIVIPDKVRSIGSNAFYGCSSLAYVQVGNSVTTIDNEAFKGCSSLASVELPNSITRIGDSSFEGCSQLSTIEIPTSITSISNRTFYGCSSLLTVEIDNSVTSIGNAAFAYCESLISLDIPESVTKIGNSVFYGCYSLESINVENGNTIYDSRENCNALIETATNTLLYGCKNTIIPNSITLIGNSAFAHCSTLSSLDIPSSVTSIGDYAFLECNGLITAEIPNSVTTIGGFAFFGCSGLKAVSIGNSVTSIGNSAFYGCASLKSVEIPSSVISIEGGAFTECEQLNMVFYNAKNSTNASDYYIFSSSNITFVVGSNVEQIPNKMLSGTDCKIVSYSQLPPIIGSNSFNLSNSTAYVSSEAYINYWLDAIWGTLPLQEIDFPITSISMNVDETQIAINGYVQLSVEISPTNATLKDIYWISDNPTVAYVDLNGLVKGLSNGEATITAMAIDGSGIVATCNVTVSKIVAESLELDPSEILLSVNKTAVVTPIYSPEGISNKEFEWSCSNEDVAKFRNNSDGSITVIGVSDGEAIITCHTTDGSGLTATCDVTVSTGTGVENTKSIAANVRGENGVIRIEGADGAAVEVFNASGVCIYSGTATEIPVPQRGLYVVKVAGRATKLAL